jgi:predicted SAM-dependent methyltransferase
MVVTVGTLKLNLGCGEYSLSGFVNVDAFAYRNVDTVMSVPPVPWPDASVEEIYMGHFLEHLGEQEGGELLRECHRVLRSGGTLGVVVPDFFEICRRYIKNEFAPFAWSDGNHDLTNDVDGLCRYLIFSTIQPSHHKWMYDEDSLRRALERAGFVVTGEIDRLEDPRLSTPRWYQFGLDARKP